MCACSTGTAHTKSTPSSTPSRGSAAVPQHRGHAPVTLSLWTPERARFETSAWRGKPLLLYVFATFDGASQAGLKPLQAFSAAYAGQLTVIGVLATQPNARQLLALWRGAIQPNFRVGYDATRQLADGHTPLGQIREVPTYIMLDASGIEVDRRQGYASKARLEQMRQRVQQ